MTYGATEFAGAVTGWTCDLHEKCWDAKAGSSAKISRTDLLEMVRASLGR